MERRRFLIFCSIFSVFGISGCEEDEHRCAHCGMAITEQKYLATAIDSSGKKYFFDDFGCMILYTQKLKKEWKMSVYAQDSKKMIDARNACYSRTENTPMKYGFGAYEMAGDSTCVSFDVASEAMLKGETMANPLFRHVLQKEIGR
ncbi:MAG: hypothetical protein ACTTJS_04955 [Wolinella sp.]